MLRELKPGTKVNYMLHDFIVSHVAAPKLYMYRVGDGALIDMPLTEILERAQIFNEPMPEKNHSGLMQSVYDGLSDESKKDIEKWVKRLEIIVNFREIKYDEQKKEEFFEKHSKLFDASTDPCRLTQEKVIQAVGLECKLDKRTVKRYLYPYLEHGLAGIISMIAIGPIVRKDTKNLNIRNPYKHAEKLQTIEVRIVDENYINIIALSIERDFLSGELLSPIALIRRIEARCAKQGVHWPNNISTLYKIIGKIDERHIARFRGTKSEQSRFVEVQSGYTNVVALYPGHIVEIDHKLIDLIKINEDGDVVGRAWLTLAIDLYTRMIWGIHLSYYEPSIDKVLATLMNGTFLKRSKEQYGTKNDWPIYGKPKIFHFDNGKDFRSFDIERVVTEVYGAELHFRPIRVPRNGGGVERIMRTLDTNIFHNLSGTTKSRPSQLRGNPADSARFTLDEATRILTKWIVDVYHYTDHEGLPLATPRPIDMYNEGTRVFGSPAYIDPLDEPQFKLNMMRQATRYCMKYGVRYENIEYKAPELSDIMGSRKRVIVKYDNSDISKVYVLHPVTKKFVVATGSAVKYRGMNLKGMSRATFDWIQKRDEELAAARKKSTPGNQSLHKAKAQLDTMMYGKNSSKRDRKTAEKFKASNQVALVQNSDAKLNSLFGQLKGQDKNG